MSEEFRMDPPAAPPLEPDALAALEEPCGGGPSERQSHSEHRAALDATVFRAEGGDPELVLELEAGVLRVRPGRHRDPASR